MKIRLKLVILADGRTHGIPVGRYPGRLRARDQRRVRRGDMDR
jgi:hypothetical protein